MSKKYLAAIAATIAMLGTPAVAGVYTGHVTNFAPEGLPAYCQFTLDVGDSQCPVDTWLTWQNSNPDNVEDVCAAILLARGIGYWVTFAPLGSYCTNAGGPNQYFHIGTR